MTVFDRLRLQASRPDDRRPLYEQVKAAVLDLILSASLKPGDQLPPESELCTRFGVSKGTIRQGILELVREGYLVRRQGVGTFVTPIDFAKHQLNRFFRYAKDRSPLTLLPTARLVSQRVVRPPAEVRDVLGLSATERVIALMRLRLVEEEPLILQTSYLPERLFRGLRGEEADRRLLYDVLGERFGLYIARADEYLGPGTAAAKEARLLGVPAGTPVLRIDRIAYTRADVPFEFRRSVGRGDRFYYFVQLR